MRPRTRHPRRHAFAPLNLTLFLAGRWHIERRIADLHSGASGRLIGEALFAPAPAGLRYDEHGVLVFGSYSGPASRSYVFALDGGCGCDVRFDDGPPFHRLDLSEGVADVTHDCVPDHYRGRYRVKNQDRWNLIWLIQGPRKRMVVATRYERIPPPAIEAFQAAQQAAHISDGAGSQRLEL